jgi:hypothetical protein
MAQELLRYRPTEVGQDAWLARITELVQGAGPAPSRAAPPPPSLDIVPSRGRPGEPAPNAPPPPPPPPPPAHDASSPDCLILQRAPEDARVILERQRERQNRAVQNLAAASRNNRAPVNAVVAYGGGCHVFIEELRPVAWPTKFRLELPPRFDGTANPI